MESEPKVKREPGRFYAVIDGHDSQLIYKLIDGVMDIVEVSVHEAHRGRGIAAELCKAAFAFAAERGYRVAPTCPYVREKFLPEHPELEAVVEKGGLFYKAQKK